MNKLKLGQAFQKNVYSQWLKMSLLLLVTAAGIRTEAQVVSTPELVFKNAVLETGTAGADNAVYRFKQVRANVDALVKINGRSSSLVKLKDIDLATSGHGKAFQPWVTYGNDRATGVLDWWMEFQVSFVQGNSTVPVIVSGFEVTALDIDGNGDKINEYVNFYGQKSYTMENNTSLEVLNLWQTITGVLTNVGKMFEGPKKNYVDIDTAATKVMVTNKYQALNTFKMRTGAQSSGANDEADRMYSFWFKGFTYTAPVTSILPVSVINWNATYVNNSVQLKWTTTFERNASHFTIERSLDGIEYTDAAILMAAGNSEVNKDYSFTDKLPAGSNGVIYYRLRLVDMDGQYKTSTVKIVRTTGSAANVRIQAFPNPVTNDLRVTIPQQWQDKPATYELLNGTGQPVKSFKVARASQTEVIGMTQSPAGIYLVRVTSGTESSVQTVVKTK